MIINNKLAFINKDKTKREEIFELISEKLLKEKLIIDKEKIINGFKAREKEFSTGLGDGFAIPHTTNNEIKEAKIVFVRLKTMIEWDSLDGKPIDTIIAIIVPTEGRNEHFELLTSLSSKLAQNSFKNEFKKMPLKEVVEVINGLKSNNKDEELKDGAIESGESKYIIGITACPTGIAHTFMAKQKIVDASEEKGYKVWVETQGADGIKSKLTREDIDKADGIIISTGIALEGMERFEGYEDKIFEFGLQETIANPEYALEQSISVAKAFNDGDKANLNKLKDDLKNNPSNSQVSAKSSKLSRGWKIGMGHVMSGIGAMIPVLLVAGFLMAIGNIGALPWTIDGSNTKPIGDSIWASDANVWVNIMYYTNQVGSVLMKFMYPVFAMYLAYSIAGKLVLIPGFLGGIMSQGIIADYASGDIYSSGAFSWAYPNGFVASGFFGAIIIGFFVGYFAKYLNEKIQFSPNLIALKTMLIIPLLLTIFTAFSMMFIINPIFGQLNYGMQQLFVSVGDGGMYSYQSLISAGTAFDLGGPINKAAGAVANPFNADAMQSLTDTLSWATSTTSSALNGVVNDGLSTISSSEMTIVNNAITYAKTFNITGRTLAIIIPPIGVGLAVLTGNSITKRDLFTKEDQQVGGTAMFLGIIGISEGAIPFMLKWPLIIISANIIGAILGTIIALLFGSMQQLPLPAIWGWFLVGTTTPAGAYGIASITQQISGYIIGLVIGSLTTATIIVGSLYLVKIKETKQIKFYELNYLEEKYETMSKNENKNTKHFKKEVYRTQNAIKYSKDKIIELLKNNKSELDKLEKDTNEIQEIKLNFNKMSFEINREIGRLPKEKYSETKCNNKIDILEQKKDKLISSKKHIDIDKNPNKYRKIEIKINEIDNQIKLQKDLIKESKEKQTQIKKEIGEYLNSKYNLIKEYEKQFNKFGYPQISYNLETKEYYTK